MPNLFPSHDDAVPDPIGRNRVLRDADPHDLEDAADALRERTMSLEAEERIPGKWLIGAILLAVGGVAACTVLFRAEIRGLLGFS